MAVKLLAFLTIILCCTQVQAQNVEGQIIASQFGQYRVPGIQTGSLQFEPATCQVTGGGKNFAAFTTGVPVKIIDANPALNEIDTPAAVFISSCAISMATQHIHTVPFYVTSGTGGLQEALLNGLVKSGGPNTIILNADWYEQVAPGNPATVIASVHGNSSTGLIDVTQTPYVFYSWNGSQYVQVAFAGGFIPATNSVLCGTGTLGSSVACGALPNGTTATTQGTADNSTKVATTAYVAENAGAALPTNALVFGTAPTTSRAATSNDLTTLLGLNSASYGFVPVTTGSGNALALQAGILQFGSVNDNYLVQPNTPFFFTSFKPNSMNKEFYVEGFNSAAYPGVGQATIPWSNTVDAPLCQSVSSGGNFYIAVTLTGNHTITPGTNLQYWWPDTQTGATHPFDCAWAVAESYKVGLQTNAIVKTGAGVYPMKGVVDYINGVSSNDQYAVSLEGCGIKCSYIQYVGAAAIPMIKRPTGGANYASMNVKDVLLDGNGAASAALELSTLGQAYIDNVDAGHVAPGSDHVLEFGASGGDGFQVFPSNINIGVFPDQGTVNCGVFTANLTSTTLTSFTVNNGGNCYQVYSGSTELTVVQVKGFKGGTSTQPCTVMPTGMVATIVGTAVTAISAPTGGGTGCSGTIDVQVYQTPNVAHGMVMNASDSTVKDVITYVGSVSGFVTDATDYYIHLHPATIPVGIANLTSGYFAGTECDAISDKCFDLSQAFANNGTTITNTFAFIGGNRFLPGQEVYHFENALAADRPIVIGLSGPLCVGNPGGGFPTDWESFVTQTGPIVSASDYASKAPAGLTVIANDTSCSQAMGDYLPSATIGTLNFSSLSAANIYSPATGTATSSANFGSSGNFGPQASTWNGSAPITSVAGQQMVTGTGTNPTLDDVLSISNCPSGRTCTFQFNNPITVDTINPTNIGIFSSPTGLNFNDFAFFNQTQFFNAGVQILNFDLEMEALGTATGGGNFATTNQKWNTSYWNGSAAANDTITCNATPASGTNPLITLGCSGSGSSGGHAVNFGMPFTATTLAAGNGFSGTKTAGSCVLTIASGIITNVTGC